MYAVFFFLLLLSILGVLLLFVREEGGSGRLGVRLLESRPKQKQVLYDWWFECFLFFWGRERGCLHGGRVGAEGYDFLFDTT